MGHFITETIESKISDKIFPGIAIQAGKNQEILFSHCAGHFTYDKSSPPILENSTFDIASLSKAICTTSLCMKAVQEDRLKLDQSIVDFFPDLAGHRYTVEDLLSHRSGLKDRLKFYLNHQSLDLDRKNFLTDIAKRGRKDEQPGHYLYSDLNFILLAWILEDLYQENLDQLFNHHMTQDLQLSGIEFNPKTSKHFVPTEFCTWRKKLIQGEVHDDNAYIMNGVAGHAGLFSDLTHLSLWTRRMIQDLQGTHAFFTPKTWQTFTTGKLSLGWDRPTPPHSLAGKYFSPHSIGHLAFTGCSFWIDLTDYKYIILLSNRTFPLRSDKLRFNEFRREIHNSICEAYLL